MDREASDRPSRYALCAEDVCLGYGEKIILKHINFCVKPAEIITILGGSGCGKSTLLKSIIGLLPPQSGKISIYGKEVTGLDGEDVLAWARRRIGVLFQSGALVGSLTVAENIALPIHEFAHIPRELVDDIVHLKLEMVRLSGYGGYYPADLSGGMRKRAALARAIALDPDILFCDEPSAGLDPVISAQMDQLLIELNRSLRITMVVITHDLPSIKAISHWSIMLDGQSKGMIAMGPPSDLEKSADPRVSAFFRRQSPMPEPISH